MDVFFGIWNCHSHILTGVVILEFDVHMFLLLALILLFCVVSATLGYSFDDLVEFMKKSLDRQCQQ